MSVFVLLFRVFTHVILGILPLSFCVYVCVVVESMYTCNTVNIGNKLLCLCLYFCIEYVYM